MGNAKALMRRFGAVDFPAQCSHREQQHIRRTILIYARTALPSSHVPAA